MEEEQRGRQKTELGEVEKEEDKEKGEWEERMKKKENEDKLCKRDRREQGEVDKEEVLLVSPWALCCCPDQ